MKRKGSLKVTIEEEDTLKKVESCQESIKVNQPGLLQKRLKQHCLGNVQKFTC